MRHTPHCRHGSAYFAACRHDYFDISRLRLFSPPPAFATRRYADITMPLLMLLTPRLRIELFAMRALCRLPSYFAFDAFMMLPLTLMLA